MSNWKKLKERQFKGAYKTFVTKTYRDPKGQVHDFDIWYVPDGFVHIFALTPNKHVVISKQFRTGPEKVLYEMPAGLIDKGESPRQCAIRELREETGYRAAKLTLIMKDAAYMPYGEGGSNFFLAEGCRRDHVQQLDHTEDIEVVTMPIKQYMNRVVRKGLLSHADGAWFAVDYLIRHKQLKYSDITQA